MKNLRTLPPFLLFFLLLASVASAQADKSRINKKLLDAYEKAYNLAGDGKHEAAIPILKELIRKEPKFTDAYLSLAGINMELRNYEETVSYYEQAFSQDSVYTSDYRLSYSIALAGLARFQDALNAADAVLRNPKLDERTKKAANFRRKSYAFAVDFQMKHKDDSYRFTPVNLGDAINTPDLEYFPTFPIEGDMMIFTRRVNRINEDFYGAVKVNGVWQKAQPIASLNTQYNEAAQSVSQDGRWLVFDVCYKPDSYGSCDLYISYRTNSGWSAPSNLGGQVNSEQWDAQPCLSPDKRDLYFTSSRAGGFGGSDIYVTHMQANGRWSEAENMGPTINTAGDEGSPFIHADNQTFYFTSSGHPGYGDMDLFISRRSADGNWSKPENLGYPINTIENEGSLFVTADGGMAYYASDRREGKGGTDIYSFEMREDIRPAKTLWIRGQVFDKLTSAGLPSTVELIDLATNRTLSRVQTDETGNYLITLPVGKDYAFNVMRKGYLFYSDNYSLKQKAPDSTYQKNIPLQPLEVNASVVLRNIFFDYNKFELKTESTSELDRLAQLLKDNPGVKIQIEGHTDNIGNTSDNLKLSEMRAKSVAAYLVAHGIRQDRLTSKGFGAGRPVADNKTEDGRALNRRTEVKITAK